MRILPFALLFLIISCSKPNDPDPTPAPPPPEPPVQTPGYISFEEGIMKGSISVTVSTINPDGSAHKPFIIGEGAPFFSLDHTMPEISFDRKKIVFTSDLDGEQNDEGIYIMDSSGENIQKVIDDPKMRENGGSLSPDGKTILYYASDSINYEQVFTCNLDGSNRKQLTYAPSPGFVRYAIDPEWSKDGKKINFISNRDTNYSCIYTMNIDGSDIRRVGAVDTVAIFGAKLSPDGKKFVYYRRHGKLGAAHMEIWTINSDGSNKKQITFLGTVSADPAWSPDSKQIVFTSHKDKALFGSNSTQLYIIKEDGTDIKRITGNATHKMFPCWR